MVALVVVADAGVRADHRGGLVDAVGVDLARRRAPSRSRARGCRRSPRAGAARRASFTLAMRVPHLGLGDAEPLARAAANGRGSSGKSHWTALSSSRSSASSWSSLVVVVIGFMVARAAGWPGQFSSEPVSPCAGAREQLRVAGLERDGRRCAVAPVAARTVSVERVLGPQAPRTAATGRDGRRRAGRRPASTTSPGVEPGGLGRARASTTACTTAPPPAGARRVVVAHHADPAVGHLAAAVELVARRRAAIVDRDGEAVGLAARGAGEDRRRGRRRCRRSAPPDIVGRRPRMPVSSSPATSTPVPASTITSRSDTTSMPTAGGRAAARRPRPPVCPTRGARRRAERGELRGRASGHRRAAPGRSAGSLPTTLAGELAAGVGDHRRPSVTPAGRLWAAVDDAGRSCTTTPEPTGWCRRPCRRGR